ncbi:hypothetical protein THAOC_03505 [Thalassiosira oceanica]|uniref:Uncharacterized protein n=1 Tax=Thalassiosira oceanica TaxID=159749 RepID=K0TPS4_THAOC|nr:hypothetical protein THAOC_03505 [Thalassiosira oceanica]|eukprot:EJK74802.1 hypothetical protein THAOC_03505 [Thalassiosira oceanica]
MRGSERVDRAKGEEEEGGRESSRERGASTQATTTSLFFLTNMKLPFAVALLAASAAAFTPSAVAPRTVSASSLK